MQKEREELLRKKGAEAKKRRMQNEEPQKPTAYRQGVGKYIKPLKKATEKTEADEGPLLKKKKFVSGGFGDFSSW